MRFLKSNRLLLLLAFAPALAPAQSCPCSDQFNWLRQKIALNYSGYRDKVQPNTQADFDQHTTNYQAMAGKADSDTACFRLLTEWARWFRDGHVQISSNNRAPEDPVAIRQRFADWETIALSEADARIFLTQPMRDPLEGIYVPVEGNYRVALVRNPSVPGRDFAAILLKADSVWWMPGQIKFDLKKTAPGQYSSRYYMRDHSERNPRVTAAEGILRFEDLGDWYRVFPGTPAPAPKRRIFTLAQLDSNTLLLRVPTMNEGVREVLDSLVQANKSLLAKTPNLIIDCRGNGGGSDITFFPLQPFVYTGPVEGYTSQVYATANNIEKYERLAQDESFPKLYRANFKRQARKMQRKQGQFVGKCRTFTQKVKPVGPNPQRVAVLIDGGCASSCEQFVYYARQSKRVTLIGQNTAGILDYGNLHNLDFPCGGFNLAYPTTRSCRIDNGQGLDGVGIPPDLRVEDQDQDWVDFAREYLRK